MASGKTVSRGRNLPETLALLLARCRRSRERPIRGFQQILPGLAGVQAAPALCCRLRAPLLSRGAPRLQPQGIASRCQREPRPDSQRLGVFAT